jgi:hypothetical protein
MKQVGLEEEDRVYVPNHAGNEQPISGCLFAQDRSLLCPPWEPVRN